MAGDIGELLAEAGLGRDTGALLFQPAAEGQDQKRGPRLSFGEPALGRAGADLGLDGVEFGEPAQALGGDLRAAAVVDFAEPAPTMCPAVCQPQRRAAPAAPAGQPVVTGISIDPRLRRGRLCRRPDAEDWRAGGAARARGTRRCWRTYPARTATLRSSPAACRAPTSPIYRSRGAAFARVPIWRTCEFTTSGTRMLRGRWPWARASQ